MKKGKWKRQPQETTGSYYFNGAFYATRGITHLLTEEEIISTYQDVQSLIKEQDGIDYLLTVRHINGKKKRCRGQPELSTNSVRPCLSLASNGLKILKRRGKHSMAGQGKGR